MIQAKDVFPELADPRGNRNIRSAEVAQRDRAVREAYRRMQRQGWENVTVVNLHPFQLNLPMGALGHLTIPAKKAGEMYAMKVIDTPRLAMEDNGDGKFLPIPVFPKELAEDLLHHYKDQGGVFYFLGTGSKPPEGMFDAALDAQHKWYWELYQEGNANWQEFHRNPKHISDRMRDAAKELFKLKLIDKQPEWIVISRSESPDYPCEGCGQIIPKVAKFCPTCHTIYNADWVRATRPDIWAAQNPPDRQMKAVPGGTGSGAAPDFDGLIAAEEKDSE